MSAAFRKLHRQTQGDYFALHHADDSGFKGSPYRVHPDRFALNLAPAIQKQAAAYFAEKGIAWHQHANHGLSSQVCCLNFLMPLAQDPERLARLVGRALGIAPPEMLPMAPETGGVVPRITVMSFRGIADQMFQLEHGARPRIPSDTNLRDRLKVAAKEVGLKGYSDRFLASEWTNVIDAWGIATLEDYATVQRMGRKSPLGPKQRAALWPVFATVRSSLRSERLMTWAGVFSELADSLGKQTTKPFDHIVLDEAQDLAPAELRFFAALAPDRPDALFLAGDMGQRIFQHPFSWAGLGVDVRGRSHTLRVCYRTSQQIRAAADRLLPRVLRDVDGLQDERTGIVSVFDGPAPDVQTFDNVEGEVAAVNGVLRSWIDEGIEPREIGIFVRTPELVSRARQAIDQIEGAKDISTVPMHLAKGLEFRVVVVMACDEGVLPLDERVADAADEAELDDIYETERRLLYVAATRAREHLLLTGTKPPSEYLADFDVDRASADRG